MITKRVGDWFKLSYSITHTSGKKIKQAVAQISGGDSGKPYVTNCEVKDNAVELLVTDQMYSGVGKYDVFFKNYFENGELATHKLAFELTEDESKVEEASKKPKVEEKQSEDKPFMEGSAEFKVSLQFLDLATASEGYRNPLLSWIKLVFADDEPNANKQGVAQEEFPNLIKSMSYMPIKASFNDEGGLGGHEGAVQIGVIKAGQQEGNKIVAVGALYNDEYPEIVDFFKKEVAEGRNVDFSWEIRYKDSENVDGIEWLQETTTKAITAVKDPAYEGRTPLLSLSSLNRDNLLKAIDEELGVRSRKVEV